MALTKKFLFGVGNVVAMQGNDVVFIGKTMLDTGIEIGTSNTEVRGGVGNQLQAIYYHTGTFSATITDTQWSLPLIALNTGASIVSGGNVWGNESVTINGGIGTLTGTPLAVSGTTPNVYIEYEGTLYNFAYANSQFSVGGSIPDGTNVCVAYVKDVPSAQSIVIPANIVPDRVRLYITANLAGDITGSGFIGTATIEIPLFQLSGSQTISMTVDGYSNTPLTGMALAYNESAVGCADGAYYAKITEDIFGTNWWNNSTALAIEGGDFDLAQAPATKTLKVWYVANGRSLVAPNSDLTFTSGTAGTATVGENTGLVTAVSQGSSLISVKITQKPTIEASCTVTVQA